MNPRNEKAPGRTTEGLQTNIYRQQYILPVARRKRLTAAELSLAFAEALALAARAPRAPHVERRPGPTLLPLSLPLLESCAPINWALRPRVVV